MGSMLFAVVVALVAVSILQMTRSHSKTQK